MEGLGRVFNIVPTADDVEVYVADCSAVTFVGVGDDVYTVQEHQSAAGAGQDLDVVDQYYENANADGSTAWTVATQAADAAVDADGSAVVVFTVDVKSMSDNYDYLSCASTSSGLVYAILHDLNVQRAPQNLRALGT